MISSFVRRAPSSSRSAVIAAAIVAALAAPTHTASAQLGGLVKRAAGKAVEKQVEKKVDKQVEKQVGGGSSTSGDAPPTFDETILELTSERVDQVLRGLAASRALLEGKTGGPSHESLVAKRGAESERSRELYTANAKTIEAFQQKDRDINQCRSDAIHASAQKHQEAMTQRIQTDPALRDKYMQLAQKYAQAQATGDTATVRKITEELYAPSKESAKADTAAADQKCGRPPTPPAVLAQIAEADKAAATLNEQIRKLEEDAAAAEMRESKLTERQFAMAKERIEMYLADIKHKPRPGGFTDTEVASLSAKREALTKAFER